MIVFYAFTQLNMIQCMNTRMNYYPEEKAYLIVRVSPIVSYEVIEQIRKSKIFGEVFCIDMPIIDAKKLRMGKIKGLRTIEKVNVLYKFYEAYLKECFNNEKCEILLLAGGWNDAVFIAAYFAEKNPNLKILFIEEGTAVYVKSRKELYKLRPELLKAKKTTKLARYIAENKYLKTGLRHLEREVYVSSAEHYKKMNPDAGAIPLKLPCIDENNTKLYNVVQTLVQNNMYGNQKRLYVDFDNLAIHYDKRKVIFLGEYVMPEGEQLALIDRIIQEVSERNIIIKVHNSVTSHKERFALEYVKRHKELCVDRNDYYFEALYTRVDFTNKIFISRGSTIMTYAKQMWNQEPFLIFTYKLYADYLYYGDRYQMEKAALFCKSMYSDPSKIMVPNSKFEFENMVREAYWRSLEY